MIEVRESGIHGRGCFARADIPAGGLIGRFEGEPTTDEGDHVLWLSDDEAIEVTNDLRYLNHAAEPNAEIVDELDVVALRAIAADEEVTIHYGPDWADADE